MIGLINKIIIKAIVFIYLYNIFFPLLSTCEILYSVDLGLDILDQLEFELYGTSSILETFS